MAKFCQKYMAQEMLQQQHYKDGNVAQSLTTVFHKMDDMLRDAQYHEEVRLRGSGLEGTGFGADAGGPLRGSQRCG